MKKRMLGILVMMVMILSMTVSPLAADAPAVEVQMDEGDYRSGDIVAAKLYVKNAVFNTVGIAFSYDSSIMTPVLSDGSDSDNGAKLVYLENSYEDGGYFTTTVKKADKASGTVYAAVNISSYMMDTQNKTVTADKNGLHFATIYFKLLSDSKPVINLTTIDGHGDFHDKSFFIYDNGVQDAAAMATVESNSGGIETENNSSNGEEELTASALEGDIVTVEVKITGPEFNTAGFAFSYDPEVAAPVGEMTYDDSVYSILRTEAADGIAYAVLYVTPGGDVSVVDSKAGVVIASMTFQLKTDENPDFKLAEIPDDIDFADAPFFALNSGTMNQDTEAELLIDGASSEKIVASELDSAFVEDNSSEDDTTAENTEEKKSFLIPIVVVAVLAAFAGAIIWKKKKH